MPTSPSEGVDSPELASRFRGVLLGTFVGDALGLPFEGTPRGDLVTLAAAVERRVSAPRFWGYSDDTEMMIGVAESLVHCGQVEPRHMLATLAAHHDPARGYGKGMKMIFRALGEGSPWETLAATAWPEGSRGNGAAVRVGPVACLFHADEKALADAAASSARITHAHAVAVEGTVLLARAIAFLLRMASPKSLSAAELVDHLVDGLAAGETVFRAKLERVREAVGRTRPREEIVTALGHGVVADESVPIALYSVLTASESFADAVTNAVKCGGDTDTIGAMAGALGGALFGEGGIPGPWLAALENRHRGRDHVRNLADRLLEASRRSSQ